MNEQANEKDPGRLMYATLEDLAGLVRVAASDAHNSLLRVMTLVAFDDGDATGRVMDAMVERGLTEFDAAEAAGVEFTVPIAATLLAVYLHRWDDGGKVAALQHWRDRRCPGRYRLLEAFRRRPS